MNDRIWKYELNITDTQAVLMPAGAEILSVANQHGTLCLWATVDETAAGRSRVIEVIGTGHVIDLYESNRRRFIGTVLMDTLVWHVFERNADE